MEDYIEAMGFYLLIFTLFSLAIGVGGFVAIKLCVWTFSKPRPKFRTMIKDMLEEMTVGGGIP